MLSVQRARKQEKDGGSSGKGNLRNTQRSEDKWRQIGLSKPYYAIYNENGGNPTYAEGSLIGKATEMTLELEGADANVLYADNGPAESDNQFAGGTLTISTDDLLPDPMLAILGLKAEEMDLDGAATTAPKWIVYDDDQAIPYVGFGRRH